MAVHRWLKVGVVAATGATVAVVPGAADADVFDRDGENLAFFDRDTPGLLGQREEGDAFGHSFATGDFDGDGWLDLAIGTPGDTIGEWEAAGAVNVLPGTADGFTTDGDQFLDLRDFDSDLPIDWDMFGYALAAGDFDGDGYDDLAIGAPGRNIKQTQGGAIYIASGSPTGLRSTEGTDWQRFDQANSGVPGNQEPYDQMGLTLVAGDFDADGYDDVAIGIPYEDQPLSGGNVNNAGWALLMFGTESGLRSTGSYAINDPRLSQSSADARFGFALAVGDPNGDGIDDLAIGTGRSGSSSGQTKVAVFTGREEIGPSTTPTFEWPASELSQGIRSLAFGDLDANGIDDLAIGLLSSGDERAMVVRFDEGGVLDETVLTTATLPDATTPGNERLGYDVEIGEFDGDGVGDLVVMRDGSGRTGVVLSGRRGRAIGTERAYPVCCGGDALAADFDRDGIDDLAVGEGATRVLALHWVGPSTLTGQGAVRVSTGADNRPAVIAPGRFLDTRPGGETVDGEFIGTGRNLAGQFTRVQVAGRGEVPEDARAAIVNVAVVGTAAPGFMTLYPCSDQLPLSSTINYGVGDTRANAAVPRLSSDGELCIFTLTDADIVLDVSGYTTAATELISSDNPLRLLDTREGFETFDGEFAGGGRAAAGSITRLTVNNRPFGTGTADVLVNVAAVDPVDAGFLTVYPCTNAIPNASTVNYSAGQTVANGALAKASDDGEICIFTLSATDIIVDFTGIVTEFSGVTPIEPVRLADSRNGFLTADGQFSAFGRLSAGEELRLPVAGRAGIPSDASSALFNLTVVGASAPGFLTAYPCGGDLPVVSNVNYLPGDVVPNNATVQLSASGEVCLYTLSEIDLVVDVTGFVR